MFEQVVEIVPSSDGRRNGEREPPLWTSQCPSASHELIANSAQSAKGEDRGACRRGRTALGVGAKLKFAAEVVGQHRRQDVDLVGDEALAGYVVEVGVLLGLAEDLLLQPAAVEEGHDGRGGDDEQGEQEREGAQHRRDATGASAPAACPRPNILVPPAYQL